MIFIGKFWSDAVPASEDSTGGAASQVADGPEGAGGETLTETTEARPAWGSSPVEMPAWSSLLMQFGLALLVVVVLILILQKVARRFGSQWKRGQNFDDIQVLAERSMGQKLSLAIVEVSDQRWLVSISPQGIQRVADIEYEMEPPQDIAKLAAASPVVEVDRTPSPGIGGLSREEFDQFEQQLRNRLQGTEDTYPSLREFEVKS